MAIFFYLHLRHVYFVSTVLNTYLVVAATFLVVVGGGLLVVAALVGFAAVAVRRPPVIAAVRRPLCCKIKLEVVVVATLSTTVQAESRLAVVSRSLPGVASSYEVVCKYLHYGDISIFYEIQYGHRPPSWICCPVVGPPTKSPFMVLINLQ